MLTLPKNLTKAENVKVTEYFELDGQNYMRVNASFLSRYGATDEKKEESFNSIYGVSLSTGIIRTIPNSTSVISISVLDTLP